jgi:hypothetical protein
MGVPDRNDTLRASAPAGTAAPNPLDPASEFELLRKETTFCGRTVVLMEPTLASALALQDQTMDIFVEERPEGGTQIRVGLKQAAYVASILKSFVDPPIEANRLAGRTSNEALKLVAEWEEFTGAKALREMIANAASSEPASK